LVYGAGMKLIPLLILGAVGYYAYQNNILPDEITASVKSSITSIPQSNDTVNDSLGNMMPLKNELLPSPIYLSDKCKSVAIIEWKEIPGNSNTGISKSAINSMDKLCNLAMNEFPAFLKSNGFVAPRNFDGYSHKLSLMPGAVNNHGLDSRNLNDLNDRFRDKKSSAKYIWGYTLEDQKISFMHNCVSTDPEFFKKIMIHEMFHSMSMYVGTYRTWDNEERMAERFVNYVL
jgi:hypothetical protein